MRRFLSLEFICVIVVFASFAHAQQFDLAAGGNTLWSAKNNNASEAFLPPPLKGGVYPSAFVQYLTDQNRGIAIEGSFRYHQGVYEGYQLYRPILYDANAVYARRLAPKTHGDIMAGAGVETLLFYAHGNCGLVGGGCRSYLNSNHFLMHAGFGVRYYAWRNFFVRPEVHYYFIPNNYQFHSDNVFRVGVSLGYTWGTH